MVDFFFPGGSRMEGGFLLNLLASGGIGGSVGTEDDSAFLFEFFGGLDRER
jgi:hypothetical protein